jgi:hypothetical protein
MGNRVAHIKKMNPRNKPNVNEEKADLIAAGLAGSGDTRQIAQGLVVAGASTDCHSAVTDRNTKRTAAKNATKNVVNKNKAICDSVNAAGVIVEQEHPNDPDYWRGEGFDVTMEEVPETTEAGQPTNGSVTQGDHLGDADVHWDQADNVDNCRVLCSKGPVADRSQYIDVTNHDDSTSKSSMTVTLPADYCNVPVNFIVVPSNSLGDGVESVPFGGGRRINGA